MNIVECGGCQFKASIDFFRSLKIKKAGIEHMHLEQNFYFLNSTHISNSMNIYQQKSTFKFYCQNCFNQGFYFEDLLKEYPNLKILINSKIEELQKQNANLKSELLKAKQIAQKQNILMIMRKEQKQGSDNLAQIIYQEYQIVINIAKEVNKINYDSDAKLTDLRAKVQQSLKDSCLSFVDVFAKDFKLTMEKMFGQYKFKLQKLQQMKKDHLRKMEEFKLLQLFSKQDSDKHIEIYDKGIAETNNKIKEKQQLIKKKVDTIQSKISNEFMNLINRPIK